MGCIVPGLVNNDYYGSCRNQPVLFNKLDMLLRVQTKSSGTFSDLEFVQLKVKQKYTLNILESKAITSRSI